MMAGKQYGPRLEVAWSRLERETGFEPATHCLGSLGQFRLRLDWFKAAKIAAFLLSA